MPQTIEVPFKMHGNRRYLTRHQIEDSVEIGAFYKRFKHRFEYDFMRDWAYLIEEDDARPQQ
jgi:hypothetical protein